MTAEGTWDIRIKTPIGDQVGKVRVVPDGTGGFTGQVFGEMGSIDIAGRVQGDHLTWSMKIPKPMPLDLDCQADITGDTMAGTLKTGFLGSFSMEGTRAA